ncbi:MAG TPA: glycosyltransferase family 4 protein [Gaiellaceae bacterium]|nr:glycosyltransferase family 4 protein [Gaiellaceae bacterium]
MTKAVFVTQQIDPSHPNLGAATGLVRSLAERVDEVVVLALHAVPGVLPANCRVHEFGASSQVLRGARFEAALMRELSPRPSLVIAHMSPIYAVLAAPVCRPLGIPVVLWFTHWRSSATLRAAERVSTAVATVDPSSFPFASHKVRAIGHGIDVSELTCRPDPGTLQLLALGRTSPAKGLEAIVDGVRRAQANGLAVQLEIRGPSETEEERVHRARLTELAGDGITIEEPVPHSELPQVFARADLLVNAAAEGSLDKSVFEACASCVPVLASNPGFAGLLPPELLFTRGDAADLAAKIAAFAGRADRAALGHELRGRVERSHSTQSWADAILALGR